MSSVSSAQAFRASPPVSGGPASGSARQAVGAFSLVEVVLAIGLVTFAMLVIFSLLPVGLFSLQESNRQIIETEIFNTVGAELSSTPFDQLTNYCQSTRFPIYFSNEGTEVSLTNGSVPVFTVRCDTPLAESNSQLSRVTVQIGYRHDPAQTNSTAKSSKRAFLLVNRGI